METQFYARVNGDIFGDWLPDQSSQTSVVNGAGDSIKGRREKSPIHSLPRHAHSLPSQPADQRSFAPKGSGALTHDTPDKNSLWGKKKKNFLVSDHNSPGGQWGLGKEKGDGGGGGGRLQATAPTPPP